MAKQKTASVPNREELYQMAVNSAKSGQKGGARVMFQQILHDDPKNERAMLWMAKIAANKAERRKWLQAVLDVNPNNSTALSAMEKFSHNDAAERNQNWVRIGVGAYALAVLLVSLGWVLMTLIG